MSKETEQPKQPEFLKDFRRPPQGPCKSRFLPKRDVMDMEGSGEANNEIKWKANEITPQTKGSLACCFVMSKYDEASLWRPSMCKNQLYLHSCMQ